MLKMVKSMYDQIDTPALLIDETIMKSNLRNMQERASRLGVALRPHTKTHKMPEIAKLQTEYGAVGITVAKVGEAEVMAENGLSDIFIANEIVGPIKWRRIAALAKKICISFGVDSPEAVAGAEKIFAEENCTVNVRIEVETGEKRSGVTNEESFFQVLDMIRQSPHISLEGIFSHEGHAYSASSAEDCRKLFEDAQRLTLHYADLARKEGFPISSVSVGSTPSLMHCECLLEGITEIRPGTYVFMDVGQGNCINSYETCAATVLVTIISKPGENRMIGDAGAKALTAQSRGAGLCHTEGKGFIKGSGNVYVDNVYDEHTIIYSEELNRTLNVGDKIEIIPNHICPVCNLYDEAYLVKDGELLKKLAISGRGKTC